MEDGLGGPQYIGVELSNGELLLYDLDYADDVTCLFESVEYAQHVLSRPSTGLASFGMCFAPLKCKVQLPDRIPVVPSSILDGEQQTIVDSFVYVGSCVTNDDSTVVKVGTCVFRARASYAGLMLL